MFMSEDRTTSTDDPASEMLGYAYAAKHMADVRYGTKLSFDESAVEQVELILAKVHNSETRSPELLCDTSLFFGAFVGEIICKLDEDAQWVSAVEGGEFGVPFILLKNMKIFPYTWCFRRACNGPANSIVEEFKKFRRELDLRYGVDDVS